MNQQKGHPKKLMMGEMPKIPRAKSRRRDDLSVCLSVWLPLPHLYRLYGLKKKLNKGYNNPRNLGFYEFSVKDQLHITYILGWTDLRTDGHDLLCRDRTARLVYLVR